MAAPTTAKFGKFRVKLGNDASPIVYTAPCGFTSKALNLSKNLTDVNLPDCTDPDLIAWVGRDAASLSASISGEGVLASESIDTWLDAFEDTESVPVKVEAEFADQTITWTGYMHVSAFNVSAELGGRATVSVEMQSDGTLTRAVS